MHSQNPNPLEKVVAWIAGNPDNKSREDPNRLTLEKALGQLASAKNTKTMSDTATRLKPITTADVERVLQSLFDPASFYIQTHSNFAKLRKAYRFLRKSNNAGQPENLQGVLGLVCFTIELLNETRRPGQILSSARQKWLEALLNDSAVQYWFYKVYAPTKLSDDAINSSSSAPEKQNLEKEEQQKNNRKQSQQCWEALEQEKGRLQLYRVGTTSFVLRCQIKSLVGLVGKELVLKCLLFPYTQIARIAKATYDYAVTYYSSELPIAPVHTSTDKWILMDFIEGHTLQERLQSEAQKPFLLRTNLFDTIGRPLLEVLRKLSDANVQHKDLSPSNIIVSEKPDGSIKDLVLIDLGRSYLYLHKIGLAENREALFVAPEVRDDSKSNTSDLYSFGMILIELVDPQGVQGRSIPDSIYQYAPTLARFIEDLIDIEPKKRLLLFGAKNEKDIYPNLQQAFDHEWEVLRRTREVEPGRQFWVQQIKDLFFPSDELKLRHLLWRLRQSSNRSEIARYPGWLFLWFVLCTSHWLFILAIVVLWELRDIKIDAFPTFVNIARFIIPSCGSVNCVPVVDWLAPFTPDFWGHLPARLTLFSVIAQTKYYQNILAGLTARPINDKLARWAEITLRGSAVCSIGPILYCNLVQPRLWLFMLVLGYVTVGINNILCYQLAIRLLKKAEGKLSTALPADDPVLQSFRSWGSNMVVYMVLLLTISIGLSIGLLHDEWIYVIGTVGVSIFIWCISRCIRLAPIIRGRLSRAFIAGERLEALSREVSVRNVPIFLRGWKRVLDFFSR